MNTAFPGGIAYCEKCEQDRKHHRIEGRPVYSLRLLRHSGFPDGRDDLSQSSTSLRLWFYAMYLMASTRCGISAKQIQRETGVTYKTAWRMFRQIRSLLSEPDMQLEGESVEMDETYFGGKRKRGHQRGRPSSSDSNKACVVGMAERKGRVVALVAEGATKKILGDIAKEHILPESTVFTDDYKGYIGFDKNGYTHQRINHSAGVYVLGDVHTQTIEGFWSLVKRGISGVYHNVGKNYLQTYLDEYSFRYNRRDKGNLIFNDVFERVSERAVERPAARGRQTQTA